MRRTSLLVALVALGAAPPDGGTPISDGTIRPATTLTVYRPSSGFIDDPFAISADGKTVAYITTDGASHAELHFAGPDDARTDAFREYESVSPEHLEFLDGQRLLAVERDQVTQLARARVYTRSGPGKERLGPADTIVTATVQGTPAIVTYLKQPRGKVFTHTLAAFRASDLKPLARRVLVEDATGRVPLPGGAYKPQYFRDGYATVVGLREGAFDAARDIRKPDVEVTVDVFSGKATGDHEIADRMIHGARVADRVKHQGHPVYLEWNEELTELLLVDTSDTVAPIVLPRPHSKYDTTTLAFQPAGPDGLYFSVTVDPVNAEAVARQKADKDWIDLCTVDLHTRVVRVIARLDGQKRSSGWRLGGGRLALLHKHKGFPRGGTDLELIALPQ